MLFSPSLPHPTSLSLCSQLSPVIGCLGVGPPPNGECPIDPLPLQERAHAVSLFPVVTFWGTPLPTPLVGSISQLGPLGYPFWVLPQPLPRFRFPTSQHKGCVTPLHFNGSLGKWGGAHGDSYFFFGIYWAPSPEMPSPRIPHPCLLLPVFVSHRQPVGSPPPSSRFVLEPLCPCLSKGPPSPGLFLPLPALSISLEQQDFICVRVRVRRGVGSSHCLQSGHPLRPNPMSLGELERKLRDIQSLLISRGAPLSTPPPLVSEPLPAGPLRG